MDLDPKYTFLSLPGTSNPGINDKQTQEFLSKWGVLGNFVSQRFSFNQPFHQYHKYHLAEAFFKDVRVAENLLTKQGENWAKRGIVASSVETKHVPCSVLSMSFFSKLNDPENRVVHRSGMIRKRYDAEIDGFLVSDNLRGMLLDQECSEYGLYTAEERHQFIFRLFEMLVLGGLLCQYEDTLNPYLRVTRNMYKELIRVRKKAANSEELQATTFVLKVVANDTNGSPYFPRDPANRQNIAFLLIDGTAREITSVIHQFGGYSPLL